MIRGSYQVGFLCLLSLAAAFYGAHGQVAPEECTPVPPSHGDVQLLPSKRVLIYTGPDGTDVPELWATINGYQSRGNVAQTLCQQLGYNDGSFTPRMGNQSELIPNRMVWLSNITCPSEYQPKHILRCEAEVFSRTSRAAGDHSNDIHLECKQPSTRNHILSGDATYVGQTTLWPPTSALRCKRSRSYGMVLIKHYSYRWDYIKNDSTLSRNDTDTLCREMGYTHSVLNSLLTVAQANLTFKHHSYMFQKLGHIDSSGFSCKTGPCPCTGCCYNLSDSTSPHIDTAFLKRDPNAVLIRCSFYSPLSSSPQLDPGGHRDVCEVVGRYGTIRNQKLCPKALSSNGDEVTYTKREFAAIVATPIGFLLLVIIAMCFFRPVYRWVEDWKRRHGQGYNQLPGANNAGGGGGGGGGGQGGGQVGSGGGNQGNR